MITKKENLFVRRINLKALRSKTVNKIENQSNKNSDFSSQKNEINDQQKSSLSKFGKVQNSLSKIKKKSDLKSLFSSLKRSKKELTAGELVYFLFRAISLEHSNKDGKLDKRLFDFKSELGDLLFSIKEKIDYVLPGQFSLLLHCLREIERSGIGGTLEIRELLIENVRQFFNVFLFRF